MFTVTGRLDDGREATISWHEPGARRFLGIGRERGLDGEPDLVMRAILDEAVGRTFEATPTGPFFVADLDDPRAAVVQLTSY